MRRLFTRRQSGFTLVELMVVVVVTGLLTGVLFGPLRNVYDANETSVREVSQVGDIRRALRYVEGEIVSAVSFEYQNTVNDPSGSNGSTSSPTQWNWRGVSGDGTTNRVLVVRSYATTELPSVDSDGSRQLVYESGCVNPAVNNLVFFVRNGALYKRTIRSAASAPLCNGLTIAQRTSCAPTTNTGVCASAPRDAKIVDNVQSFSIDYYASPRDRYPLDNGGGTGQSTLYSQSTSSIPNSAQTVKINLRLSDNGTTTESSIRVSRLNGTTL